MFIEATNSENRAYNCSISFTWSHDDFGTRRRETVNASAGIGANTSAVIYRLSGSYVRFQLESQPVIQWV